MFKKGCAINQRSLLSGADRKKLRRGLEKQFPGLGEDGLELLLPNKGGELELAKVPAPSRTAIYIHDKVPIVIDVSGKGDILPTVFGLWRAPNTLPQVFVKHPFVTTYLVNGADLMLPGVDVSAGMPSFQKGDLLAVCVHGNPAPVAVGTAGMNSTDACTKANQGLKGKLVEVLQVYGDFLWSELGGKLTPNSGFLGNAVVPLGTSAEALAAGFEEEEQQGDAANGDSEAAASQGTAGAASGEEAAGSISAAAAEDLGTLSLGEGSGPTSSAPVDMDELLELTLLQSLSKAVKDGDLPLAGSVLWAQHMLQCRPAGSTLDIKKSKHKKMSKFLQAYGGKGGLLTVKEDRHSGDIMITAVDRKHQLLADFRPMPLHATAAGAAAPSSDGAGQADGSGRGAAAGSAASAAGAAASSDAAAAAGPSELVVEELWKAGKELVGVLDALNIPRDALFTEKEAGEIAFDYVKHANLEANAPDPTKIVLDAVLCDGLFKGLVKKGELFPTHLPKAELRECFLRRCQHQCRISRGNEQTVKKGGPPLLHVSAEKTRGHKITRIVDFEPFLVTAEQVAADCQKKFACSTTVNELPGKHQGQEVVIQGHLEGVPDFLCKAYGIPKKYMDVKGLPKK